MKIYSKSPVCSACSNKIASLGHPCSSLMELAIDLYLESIPFTYKDGDENERIFKIPLDYLEQKGFVLSTEIGEGWVQIVPNLSKCRNKRMCWC